MPVSRRALAAFPLLALLTPGIARAQLGVVKRFGQVNRLTAKPTLAEALIKEVLTLTGRGVAGCQLYATTIDATNSSAIWTVEIWDSEAAHAEAVATPALTQAIERCKPLIKQFAHIATFYLD